MCFKYVYLSAVMRVYYIARREIYQIAKFDRLYGFSYNKRVTVSAVSQSNIAPQNNKYL